MGRLGWQESRIGARSLSVTVVLAALYTLRPRLAAGRCPWEALGPKPKSEIHMHFKPKDLWPNLPMSDFQQIFGEICLRRKFSNSEFRLESARKTHHWVEPRPLNTRGTKSASRWVVSEKIRVRALGLSSRVN